MKNEKLFNETIDKLVKAYFEGTLEHEDCNKCAVGNIVGNQDWSDHFVTIPKGNYSESVGDVLIRQNSRFAQIIPGFKYCVRAPFPTSDYSRQELMDIEWAFETAPKEGDWEFNGLMAVVDVLEKIHECDKETTELTKKRFVKV